MFSLQQSIAIIYLSFVASFFIYRAICFPSVLRELRKKEYHAQWWKWLFGYWLPVFFDPFGLLINGIFYFAMFFCKMLNKSGAL